MGGIVESVGSVFKKAPKAPKAPDVGKTLDQQAYYNQIFQYTPQGNLEYGTVGEDGEFQAREGALAAKVSESDFQKAFREGREGIALGLLENIDPQAMGDFRTSTQIESNLGDIDTDFVAAGDRFEQEMFADTENRLRESYESRREDLIQNLADRGIPLSSEAGQAELSRLDEALDEGISSASFGALQAGRAEQDRLTRLSAALRGQTFNEQASLANLEQQQRAQRFGEIGSLSGFGTQFQNINPATVNAAGIINQGYSNQLGRYDRDSARFANLQKQGGDILGSVGGMFGGGGGSGGGGIGGLGSMMSMGSSLAGLLSDIRAKENIEFSHKENGHKIYNFNYKGDDRRFSGVMAQDVIKYRPDVVTIDNGYYKVNYKKLGIKMQEIK